MKQVESTDVSWFVLIIIASAIAGLALFSIVKSAINRNSTESAWALAYEAAENEENATPVHIVVPPYLGDAVAAGQNVCGCPGCCQVLNS